MFITFNLELDFKPNQRGEKLLMVRCSQHRKHKRISLGIHLLPKFWDFKKKEVKRVHPSSRKYNDAISQRIKEITEVYLLLMTENKGEVSLNDFMTVVQKPTSQNFFQFAKDFKLNSFKAKNKLGTYRRYESILKKFSDFAGQGLTIKQVNYTLLKEYEIYLMDVLNNGRDTISSNLSAIRSILNEAIKHGYYDKRNPFDSISLKYTSNTKSKLTVEELRAFSSVPLPNISSLHLARDFFMACFYAAGCRGGDMVTLKWENIKEQKFCYTQQKTGKYLELPILPELALIFEKYKGSSVYIFPLIKSDDIVSERVINSRLTYINKYIKEVCKYAGIFKKISTHCARHTFSDISLSLNQNDIFSLKDVLGHTSVKTTEGYLIKRNYSKAEEYLNSIRELLSNKEG